MFAIPLLLYTNLSFLRWDRLVEKTPVYKKFQHSKIDFFYTCKFFSGKMVADVLECNGLVS